MFFVGPRIRSNKDLRQPRGRPNQHRVVAKMQCRPRTFASLREANSRYTTSLARFTMISHVASDFPVVTSRTLGKDVLSLRHGAVLRSYPASWLQSGV